MPDSAPTVTSETIEALLGRQSIRKYSDRPVTDAELRAILDAAVRAPTSSNFQAYSIVVVRDQAVKEQISVPAGNQKHIITCPVFLAFCADISRIETALKRNGKDLEDNNLEVGLVSSVDAALVGMAAYIAAESLGIQGVMIGAVRNDPEKVASLLGLPKRAYPVFGMCLGWPDEAPKQKPRMEHSGIVHYERYDEDAAQAAIDSYDADLKQHYDAIGKPTTDDSWTHDVAKKVGAKQRDGLRAALKNLGFDFR